MMNTILVPIDFSDNSRKAMDYAIGLATKLNMKLLLMHNYQPSMVSVINDTMDELRGKEPDLRRKKSQDELDRWKDIVKCTEPNLISYSLFTEGDFIDEIDYLIEENSIDLVVMGTKGASGFKEAFMGSNTANVMTNISCPLIAVPEQYEYQEIKQLLFTTDYHDNDLASLRFLLKIAKPFDAEVSVLHINNGVFFGDFQGELLVDFVEKTKQLLGYDKLSYELIEERNDMNVILEEYMIQKNIDLVAMSTRVEKGKRSIFTIGLVNKMIHHSSRPLLIFHTND